MLKMKTETRETIELEIEGKKIIGVFHKPLSDSPFPTVLICHGLAGNKIGRFRVYVELAQKLAQAGIGVLRIDFRGSGDSEGDFIDMTITSELEDAKRALDYLTSHPQVDAKRIGLFGTSLGGLIAIITAAKFKHIKAIALWSPIYSIDQWRTMYESILKRGENPELIERYCTINGQLVGKQFFHDLYDIKMEELIKEIPPNTPWLHIHGEPDELVVVEHARSYEKLKSNALGPVKFIYLPNTDHDFSEKSERQFALLETAHWFEEHL
jgi:dipeptidyl aminopeptidase/acylaminoacyl peptidase